MKRLLKNKYFILAVIIFIASLIQNISNEKTPLKQEGEMRVHFIDVGEGDSTFIEFPDGKTMLVDAGEKGEDVVNYLEKCKAEKIDFLVGTHPHSDHIGGLETVIRNMDIGEVYMPKVTHNTATFEDLLISIKEKGLKINPAAKGDVIHKADGLLIEVLSPENKDYDNLNNYSIVLKIAYGDTVFLLTGDAETEILSGIHVKDIDVLKVPHHGSVSSLSKKFLDKASPKYGIISLGEGNQYGHPHYEVIEDYKKRGIKLYRTDENGSVIATSDGVKVTVKGERE